MNEQQAGGPVHSESGRSPKQEFISANIYQGGGGVQQPLPASVPESGFSVAVMLRLILRRWVTVVLFAILGTLGAVFYIQNVIPFYLAEAELEMSVRRPKVINSDAIYEDPNAVRDTDVIFNTRFAKFGSPAMEKLVAKEFLRVHPEKKVTERGFPITRYTLSKLVRDVRWFKDPDANIVHVSYVASDPLFAAELVNVISHCAGLLMMEENRAQSDEAVMWLVTQASEQRAVVEAVEDELALLREELKLDSIQQQLTALGKALVGVSAEKEELISQLESRKTVYEFVAELRVSDQNLEMLPSGLPKEKELGELIRGWRAANDDLLLAADRYTEIHPEYRAAAELEARARERLNQFIELSAKAVQNEIALLEKQIEQMAKRIQTMKNESLDLEQTFAGGMRQVQELERKRDIAADSYQGVLKRIEEARLSADENMAFTKVIRNAHVPKVPVSPNRIQALVLGTFLGALCGSGLALIIALWTDKIGAVSDLKALGLNIFAVIPSLKTINSRGQLATIALRDKFNPVVEVFSAANAIISSHRYAGQFKVLMVCSVGPGAGKTVSACNLAICSSNNGNRTLLIDCDLRRPQVANIFYIDPEYPSLIECLSRNEEFSHEELVCKGPVDGLDIISSRPNPDITPAELLGRDELEQLLDWARQEYDRIIIDSPPLGPVGDAQILANRVDGVIFVARIGTTLRRGLRFALTQFREMDVDVIGCIANDVPHSLAGMFGGGGQYGYGSYKNYN